MRYAHGFAAVEESGRDLAITMSPLSTAECQQLIEGLKLIGWDGMARDLDTSLEMWAMNREDEPTYDTSLDPISPDFNSRRWFNQ